jgi:hypothetical protein
MSKPTCNVHFRCPACGGTEIRSYENVRRVSEVNGVLRDGTDAITSNPRIEEQSTHRFYACAQCGKFLGTSAQELVQSVLDNGGTFAVDLLQAGKELIEMGHITREQAESWMHEYMSTGSLVALNAFRERIESVYRDKNIPLISA